MGQGIAISGKVTRVFQTEIGEAYGVQLQKPVELNGESCAEISIGGMKGLGMALQAAKCNGAPLQPPALQLGDTVRVESTRLEPPKQAGHSPMVCFAVEVVRGGKVYKGRTEDAFAPFVNADFWGFGGGEARG